MRQSLMLVKRPSAHVTTLYLNGSFAETNL